MTICPMPVIMLKPEHLDSGTIYHAANIKAEDLQALMSHQITDWDLPKIEALGFYIVFPNGEPVLPKFPRGACVKKMVNETKHIKDDI